MWTNLRMMGGAVLVIVGAVSFVVTLGTRVTKYDCNGALTVETVSAPARLTMKLKEYRSFVAWTGAKGTAKLETSDVGSFDYPRLERTGADIRFSDPVLGTGVLQDVNKRLSVSLGKGKRFEGYCENSEQS